MALIKCSECGEQISERAISCPKCGNPLRPLAVIPRGYQWKSKATLFGWPLIHIAFGRNKDTGGLLVAKGIIAIGQFGIGVITVAQFGIGLIFGFGQFMLSTISVGQFALGIVFGLGQFATGITAIGQIAFGKYVLASSGYGIYVWSKKLKDPEAIEYFTNLWNSIKGFFGLQYR